jgi:hypothetical protein
MTTSRVYNDQLIIRRDDMMSLTDLCRAVNGDQNPKPSA